MIGKDIPGFQAVYVLDKLVSPGTHSDSLKTLAGLAKWLHRIINGLHEDHVICFARGCMQGSE